jgi:hypothetical protein
MTFCKGGCGKTTSGPDRVRCRSCANALQRYVKKPKKKPIPPGSKEWNQTFSHGPRTKFGKATQPAACGFSWWAEKAVQADPVLFTQVAAVRAKALHGTTARQEP